MADAKSEDFKKFILENREMIESILNEGRQNAKDEVKAVNDTVLRIVNDDEVQKHFVSGCLEFLRFFEAVLEAAPLPAEAREIVDDLRETKDKVVKNTESVKSEKKKKVERIDIKGEKKPSKKKTKKA